MLWDYKYIPRTPEIICPVCNKKLERKEWEDFGMHYKCTECYKMKRYITSKLNINDSNQRNDVTKTIVNEI